MSVNNITYYKLCIIDRARVKRTRVNDDTIEIMLKTDSTKIGIIFQFPNLFSKVSERSARASRLKCTQRDLDTMRPFSLVHLQINLFNL